MEDIDVFILCSNNAPIEVTGRGHHGLHEQSQSWGRT